MVRKILTTINIDPDQLARLKALSKLTGTSMAEYVRRGVKLVLSMEGG